MKIKELLNAQLNFTSFFIKYFSLHTNVGHLEFNGGAIFVLGDARTPGYINLPRIIPKFYLAERALRILGAPQRSYQLSTTQQNSYRVQIFWRFAEKRPNVATKYLETLAYIRFSAQFPDWPVYTFSSVWANHGARDKAKSRLRTWTNQRSANKLEPKPLHFQSQFQLRNCIRRSIHDKIQWIK